MSKVEWQGKRQSFIFLAIAIFVVAIDQLSKWWIRSNLAPGTSLPREGIFRLTHVQNTGFAFGILTNQAFLLTIVSLISILFILFFYYRFSPPSILSTISVGLIFGGSVGNLIDRIRLGYVTDFVDVRLWRDFHWPMWNAADASITVGAIILIISLLWLLKKGG